MLRVHLAAAFVALLLVSSPALAQRGTPRGAPNYPITVASPGSSIPAPAVRPGPPVPPFPPGHMFPGHIAPWHRGPIGFGGFGLPFYAPYALPANGVFDTVNPSFQTPIGPTDAPAPPIDSTGFNPASSVKLTGMPAQLTLQFPAAAKVWLNGREVEGKAAKERELSSPAIAPGTDFAFDVRAEWRQDGETYEYTRWMKVAAGERSRITVLSGTPKK